MSEETIIIDGERYSFGVGASLFRRAVAQEKVAIRKRWLAALEGARGRYSVRYGDGGVTLTRLEDHRP